MPLKTHRDEETSLNLTPMIDIVFLLIIFFMVGTKFTEMERKIALEVPTVRTDSTLSPAPEKRVINVHRNGSIDLDDRPVTLAQLKQHLASARAQYADLGVIVRGDGQATHELVSRVLAACEESGVRKMGVSVRVARRTP